MKNFALSVFALLLAAVYCPAEAIDAVTFNPARLGQYERLKVSDDLTSPGGVEARSVAVQSGGTVSVENAGNYDITQAEVKGSVNMTSTGFEAPKVDSRGGTASFEQTGNRVESRINTLTGAVLKAKANVLRTTEVSVTGVPSAGYDGAQIQGLKLGGNDIPKRDGCNGLNWYARTAGDGNTYKVLGMKGCTEGSDECVPSYGASKTTDTYMRDTCPGFNPNASYTCSNFSQSCVDIMSILQTKFAYSGQGYAATDSTVDTCNGDRENKFPATPSSCPNSTCRDVYAAREGSPTVSYEAAYSWKCDGGHFTMSGGISPYGYEPFYPNVAVANVRVVYNQNISGTLDALAARLCSSYANDGVHDTVMAVEARAAASCSNTSESPAYFRMIKCPQLKYYYQDGTCKQTVNYRDVDCCPNK